MNSTGLAEGLTRVIEFNASTYERPSHDAACALTAPLETFGCVRIKLEPELVQCIKNALAACRAYFSLPEEEKKRQRAGVIGAAGYNPYRSEEYGGSNRREEREFFVVNSVKPELPEGTLFFSRAPRWPRAPEAFRFHLERLYHHVHELARRLARAIAAGCGVGAAFFDGMLHNGSFSTRVFRYPAGHVDKLALSLISHRDSGLLTILLGITAPGLEVRDPATGKFLAVTPPEDEAFVMVGEALAMISAGRLPAPVHRVRATSSSDRDRFVIANFLSGNDDAPVRLMYLNADNAYLDKDAAYARMTPVGFVETILREWRYDPEYSSYDADMIGPGGRPLAFL